ncbi:MAG: hydrogenase maturation nickel metallochaperone HypA [Actinobacteria bacterium]|nr:hydrogenase maturation nickel metallochaperone HypA [Actinomycetota bacterium]
MHEYSITSSIVEILDKVIKEKKLKKIKKVNFELSHIASIEPESIKFYFDFLTAENQRLKGAILKFKKNKLKLACSQCRKIFESNAELDISDVKCPACGSENVQICQEDDIRITSVETD